MARPRNIIPTYRKDKRSGRARCWVNNRWVYLGVYNSPESLAAYDRLRFSLRVASPAAVTPHPTKSVTVDEVCIAFLDFAKTHYRSLSEQKEYVVLIEKMSATHGTVPAAEFGPLALQAVRQKLIDAKWCRTRINRQVSRIRRIFRWAAGQEMVPASVPAALACVQGLQRGRTDAEESDPVLPVPRADVLATLPHVNRHVRAMIELQLCTGMRPGEVCTMTLAQIDRSGGGWVYRPDQHKTKHRGKQRVIPLGPRSRTVLLRFLGSRVYAPDEPLFSPRVVREERFAAMRATRKTKVQSSQANRKNPNPKRLPRDAFGPAIYANSVSDAAERAGVKRWSPNQIRHTVATEIRNQFGLEAAQVILGHSRADVTQIYAERNLELALRVAQAVG